MDTVKFDSLVARREEIRQHIETLKPQLFATKYGVRNFEIANVLTDCWNKEAMLTHEIRTMIIKANKKPSFITRLFKKK